MDGLILADKPLYRVFPTNKLNRRFTKLKLKNLSAHGIKYFPMNKAHKRTGVARIVAALFYSFNGISTALATQPAFRQEVALVLVLSPLALFFGNSTIEKIILLSSLLLVLIVELINSAVESAIDRIGPEVHELSKSAKDFGSAAVFFSILNAVLVWTLIVML